MAEVIRMPQLSDTMEEGVIVKWHKKEGDKVKSGDILADVETDKATMEMECFEEGTLLHIGIKEGDSVPVDAVIAVVGEKDEDYKSLLEEEKKGEQKKSDSDSGKKEKAEKSDDKSGDSEDKSAESTSSTDDKKDKKRESAKEDGRTKASPLARKIAKDNNIELSRIKGTGDNNRIVKRDVEQYLEKGGDKTGDSLPAAGQEGYEDVKVSMMRKTIAGRLSESKHASPHFYLNVDIKMDEAIKARKQLMDVTEKKLSFNDLVIKAAALALRRHPDVNVSWLGDKVRRYKHIHVGVAIAVEEGLLVPVVRFADQKGITQIAGEVREYADKAQNKALEPSDWEGNTFTISNLGMFGIDDFTAIINPPDACIMAVGQIKEVPVAENGKVTTANMMRVTLSCDHRVVDGATGAKFLQTFKQFLEFPVTMIS